MPVRRAIRAEFNVLKTDHNADVVAYEIMPNYLHVILQFHYVNFNLNTIVGNAKRCIAYEIINQLEAAGNNSLPGRLVELVTEREKRKCQLHKVFKSFFDAKAIITKSFLMQKINYIYNNPVS